MPSALLTNSFVSPVSMFVSVTVPPATAAPEVSSTVPRMSPEFVFCARPPLVIHSDTRTTRAKRNAYLIFVPSHEELSHTPSIRLTLVSRPTSKHRFHCRAPLHKNRPPFST